MMMEADEEGRLELEGLGRGSFGSCVLESLAEDPLESRSIQADRTGRCELTLVDPNPAARQLRGSVHTPLGVPLTDVEVRLTSVEPELLQRPSARTDALGRFELRVPGEIEAALLEVSARGFARHTRGLRPSQEVGKELRIELEVERAIEFTFVRPDGRPLADYSADIQQVWGDGVARSVHRIARHGSEPILLGGFGGGSLSILVREGGLQRWFGVEGPTQRARIEVPEPARISIDLDQLPVGARASARYGLLHADSRELIRFGTLLANEPGGCCAEFVCPAGELELWIEIDGERWFESSDLVTDWGNTLQVVVGS